jgi:hypothetical protein
VVGINHYLHRGFFGVGGHIAKLEVTVASETEEQRKRKGRNSDF